MEGLPFKIDEEIQRFLTPLTSDELSRLETDIKNRGCLDPLVVWEEEGILLDGHHRLALCQKHEKEYSVRNLSFPNKTEALLWVFNHNSARRGHGDTPFFECELVILYFQDYFTEKAKKRKKQAGESYGRGQEKKVSQETGKPIHVNEELGKLAGYSAEIMRIVRFLMKHANEDELYNLRERRSNVSITKMYGWVRFRVKREVEENLKREAEEMISREPDPTTPQELLDEKEIKKTAIIAKVENTKLFNKVYGHFRGAYDYILPAFDNINALKKVIDTEELAGELKFKGFYEKLHKLVDKIDKVMSEVPPPSEDGLRMDKANVFDIELARLYKSKAKEEAKKKKKKKL